MQMEYEVTKNQMTQNGWGKARASQDAGAAKTATQNAANSKVSCLTGPTRPTTPFPAGTHSWHPMMRLPFHPDPFLMSSRR